MGQGKLSRPITPPEAARLSHLAIVWVSRLRRCLVLMLADLTVAEIVAQRCVLAGPGRPTGDEGPARREIARADVLGMYPAPDFQAAHWSRARG